MKLFHSLGSSCFLFPVWSLYPNSFPSLFLIVTGHTSFCCHPPRTPHTRLCNTFLFKNKYKCVFPSAPWEWQWVVWIRVCERGVQAKRKALSVMFSHPKPSPHYLSGSFFLLLSQPKSTVHAITTRASILLFSPSPLYLPIELLPTPPWKIHDEMWQDRY